MKQPQRRLCRREPLATLRPLAHDSHVPGRRIRGQFETASSLRAMQWRDRPGGVQFSRVGSLHIFTHRRRRSAGRGGGDGFPSWICVDGWRLRLCTAIIPFAQASASPCPNESSSPSRRLFSAFRHRSHDQSRPRLPAFMLEANSPLRPPRAPKSNMVQVVNTSLPRSLSHQSSLPPT